MEEFLAHGELIDSFYSPADLIVETWDVSVDM